MEVGTLIAIVGSVLGIVFGYAGHQRAERNNTKKDYKGRRIIKTSTQKARRVGREKGTINKKMKGEGKQ